MRLLWNNRATSSNLSVNSENANYPIENTVDIRLAKVFRSSINDNIQITISGNNIPVSYIFLLGHNIPEDADVYIEHSDDALAWSGLTNLTWNENYIYANFAEEEYNYYRVTIDFSNDSNYDDYVEIGYLYLGTYLQMPGMDTQQQLPLNTETKQTFSTGGQVYGDINYEYYNFKVKFPGLTNTQRQNIETMFRTNRNIVPMIVLIWSNDLDFQRPIYMVVEDKKLDFKKVNSNKYGKCWALSLDFREVF